MFNGISNGIALIKRSIQVFMKYPHFAIPLACVWVVYAFVVIYIEFLYPWDSFGSDVNLLFCLGVFLLLSLLYGFSALVLLELIQQVETDQPVSFGKAANAAFQQDMLKALPVLLLWVALQFVVFVLQLLLKATVGRLRRRSGISLENAARTLAGEGSILSWFDVAMSYLDKLLRMLVFLMLPAIAWEDKGPGDAISRGMSALRHHFSEFITGFAASNVVNWLVFLPLTILFLFQSRTDSEFPPLVWVLVIIYCGLAWTFGLFVEQMFSAELYLWHLKWLQACEKAESSNRSVPRLNEIPAPTILNDVPELLTTPA